MVSLLCMGAFVLAGSTSPVEARTNTAPAFPCPLFPTDNIWNTRIDSLPVDASSDVYIQNIGASDTMHADFGSGEWEGGPIGIPFNRVPGSQPKVPISFYYPDESDPGPYPIPPNAKREWGSDHHILVMDEDNCKLYEVYDASAGSGGGWSAGSGAVYDLNSNVLRPAGWTSADAAGLPMLPGLVTYDEVASGEITHALRFTVSRTNRAYIWPARHLASSYDNPAYPPMGQRFRLKTDFDISGFSPEVQVILTALKTYGMFVADNGADWYLSGAPDERWNNDDLHTLHRLRGSDFEAVDESGLMVDPDSGQAAGFSGALAPVLLFPAAGAALGAPQVDFSWQGSAGDTGYTFTLTTSAAPLETPLVNAELDASVLSYPFTVSSAGTYYWHVRAHIAAGDSLWATRRFSVALAGVQTPVLRSPRKGTTQKTFRPEFSWSIKKKAVLGYQLQVSTDRTFSTAEVDVTLAPASGKTMRYTLPVELPAAGRYYWRVRSTNGAENSGWSRASYFLTPAEISGTVTDAVSGAPLEGFTVAVNGSTLSAVSDENGRYQIKGVKPGVRKLVVSGGLYYGAATVKAAKGVNRTQNFKLTERQPISLPEAGKIYHNVYPGGQTGEENDITLADVQSYETAAGKPVGWVYFSNNWYQGRAFPLETAGWIRDAGHIPYIRLMLRSRADQNHREPVFTLQRIIRGKFDADLRAWAETARDFGTPLIVEYGTEVNGEWFSWNGQWNGGGTLKGYGSKRLPDGPERFRDAYRHIIQIMREEGAGNITWVFHANAGDYPSNSWNRMENYYPGDEWIDWLAVSAYGAQTPTDDYCMTFRENLDETYPRLAALSSEKPILVAEFGVAKNNPLCGQAEWADAALEDLITFRWPRIFAFSWWNEAWQNDDDLAHDTTMRLQDNPELQAVFQNRVGSNPDVLGNIP